jgi:hypothetical protein
MRDPVTVWLQAPIAQRAIQLAAPLARRVGRGVGGEGLLLAVVLLAAACGSGSNTPPTTPTSTTAAAPTTASAPSPTPTPAPISGTTLWAVGDIGDCSSSGDEAVAAIIANGDGPIAAVGDIVYEAGTSAEFTRCFDPAWGSLKPRIHPALGNHDYGSPAAHDYFAYFGAAAGEAGEGYYSYQAGSWHIVVLNSNCDDVPGGCAAGSAQYRWLQQDLAAHQMAACTLAYWHHPRFTSGLHGNTTAMSDLWQALYASGVDVVVGGHDHDYERFAPQDGDGHPDPQRGIREFIAGTGGATLYPLFTVAPNSETRDANTFGVLKFTLGEGAYSWEFIPVAGQTFRDSGQGNCH